MIILTSFIFTSRLDVFAESPEGTKTTDERLAELEQKIKVLERQLEIQKDQKAEQAKTSPVVTANVKEGFSIKDPNGGFTLKLRGYVQADSRSVTDHDSTKSEDTFLLRRVRPIFEGTVSKNIYFRIMPDFGGGKTALQDAWLDLKYFGPEAKLQVGKFKVPFGIERLQSGTDTLFVERGLPNNLVPNRDIGASLHGDLFKGKLSYAAGIFNGVDDGNSADTDLDENKEFAGRIFLSPFKGGDNSLLDGLGVGLAITAGRQNGTTSGGTLLPAFVTPGQQKFFSYRSGVIADGQHTRYSPQTYYSYGSFGLLGEYVVSEQEVTKGADTKKIINNAWQAAASYVLTGEPASYNGVVPKEPFNPQNGKWGAFEVVGRVGQLNIDDDAFPTFADITKSAKTANSWGAGLNWIWNKNVKWMIDYDQTSFTGGNPTGDRENERAVLVRSKISF